MNVFRNCGVSLHLFKSLRLILPNNKLQPQVNTHVHTHTHFPVPTWFHRINHVQHLTHGILNRQALHIHLLQSLEYFTIKVFQLVQWQHSITIPVQHSKPIFNTIERERGTVTLCIRYYSLQHTSWRLSCPLPIVETTQSLCNLFDQWVWCYTSLPHPIPIGQWQIHSELQ